MMPIYGMEVTRLTSGGLTDILKSVDNNCCEKSAEAIVLISNELPPLRIRAEDSQDWEGPNIKSR